MSIQDAILSHINMHNADGEILNAERRARLALELSHFVMEAIAKYHKGQREHGGDIIDRDLDHEIDNEIIDLMFYQYARRRKEKHS